MTVQHDYFIFTFLPWQAKIKLRSTELLCIYKKINKNELPVISHIQMKILSESAVDAATIRQLLCPMKYS